MTTYPTYPDLAGKKVIITAASDGMGKETARAFLQQGASVAILSRSQSKLDAVAAQLQAVAFGDAKLLTVQVDLSDLADTRAKAKQAVDLLDGVDVLFNNGPGLSAGVHEALAAGDMDTCQMEMFKINNVSMFAVFDACLPALKESSCASVINTASIVAFVPLPAFYPAAYNAAKAGVISMTRDQALLYAKDGIRVNSVSPGFTETPFMDGAAGLFGMAPADYNAYRANNTPLKVNGEPSDIAAAVLFLASSSSKWITGQDICMDGGITLTCNTALPAGAVAPMP